MTKTLTVTLQLARSAGQDTANRQMRAEGRTEWNEADYNLAARTMSDLIPSVVPTRAVKAQYPEAYYVAGVGWCGPKWEHAAALESELKGGRS